ncbi:bifunctional GNAT family N-acetyltransferase/carbon-nitrogen hydrolase family protein [Oceanobacillus caeni]|uniref:Carbon-nitrogen hydrolase n=1 Tax=Oceanobacillus caeni TaxID=405946 RepID=A0ABR5MIS0_9BACI|nr:MULTISPECIES: bifunctional GNAT family N-acetyltransferase/carbon-nitrogen hydrolase family protein [Bacillaceae]KKE78222.1 carbon-nitrogen hydrolase [Bacilli bacterium VT-13-104]PZD83809.1 GNAT family N-acetyltransferase [Bacilli bacterium]KPH74546.1 carbon-nitrogen hydrolase [Oceanobacillus caeni]MCR1836202.1 bifunctional GNAT family N-acetyltransferase/carbon-nitrogen hydrolase family protein [Oceanobacillus caeni]PZD86512.1 GNAT family N-acetyltransferase [Bacilli bacterium]
MANEDTAEFEKKLIVRNTRYEDIEGIIKMNQLGFGNPEIAFKREHFESQLSIFPEGQVCIEYEGEIIGSCSSIIVNFDDYGVNHTFSQIADDGFIRNHNPNGENLYGIEVVVHPDYRHMKIGRRLYEARREICRKFNLKSILFGGRIPNYHNYANRLTAEQYVEQVIKRNLYDPVLTFQLMNDFELIKVMPNYLAKDEASLEYATLMEWKNPEYIADTNQRYQKSLPVRITAVQYNINPISSFEEFAAQCEYYVNASSKIRSDIIVFPEAFTMQLQSYLNEKVPSKQVRQLTSHLDEYKELFSDLAIRYSINIVAGSNFVQKDDSLYHAAFLFHRNGKVDKQYKLHISPYEKKWWGIHPGNELNVFDTDCGKISILLGYDVLFPEAARMAVDRGADILVTPFTAPDKQESLRMKHCAQARAIENQVFVVTAGSTGNLTQVHHMNSQNAQSGIYSPIDYDLSENGVVSECDPNVETMVVGKVDLELLRRNRLNGTVTPLHDRRSDLYQIKTEEAVAKEITVKS